MFDVHTAMARAFSNFNAWPLTAVACATAIATSAFTPACGGKSEQALHGDSGGDGTSVGAEPGAGPAPGTGSAGTSAKPSKPGGSGGNLATGGTPTGAGGATGTPIATAGTGGASIGDDGGSPSAGEPDGGAGGEPPVINCDPIVFADADVEAEVRAEINKQTGVLTSADVAGVTYLDASSGASLKGVECLTELTSFSIGDLPPGKVTDLSPLAGLKKLHDVDLSRNPIASLEPLGKLPNLEELYLLHVPVELDLRPLATSPKLNLLNIQGDTVTDLSPLGSVTTLLSIDLRNGKITHPESVAAVKSVQSFNATAVFSDAAPLAGLTNLTKLWIGHAPLAHFESLAGLTNLKLLDVTSTGITSIAPIANMTKLSSFSASQNRISDLSPLGALGQLGQVVLVGNKITDVSALAANPGIGANDFIYLQQNSLDCAGQAASLQAMTSRGANVGSDCP